MRDPTLRLPRSTLRAKTRRRCNAIDAPPTRWLRGRLGHGNRNEPRSSTLGVPPRKEAAAAHGAEQRATPDRAINAPLNGTLLCCVSLLWFCLRLAFCLRKGNCAKRQPITILVRARPDALRRFAGPIFGCCRTQLCHTTVAVLMNNCPASA